MIDPNLRKLFIYADNACEALPLTSKLRVFIDKWNRHDRSEKYHHNGVNLYVRDQIFTRVEKWVGREQTFDYEQQEVIDCFDHDTRESDVQRLADKAKKLSQQNRRVDQEDNCHNQ